jgi:hypothetical protein
MRSMPSISPDDAETFRPNHFVNLVTDLPVSDSRFTYSDGLFHRPLCRRDEVESFWFTGADRVSCVEIRVEAYTGMLVKA